MKACRARAFTFSIKILWRVTIVMSTNLEYRARERQGKRKCRRQASEAQREKERQSSRARVVGRTTWNFCNGGEKTRKASSHQCKGKWAALKKSEREHVRPFLHKTCNYIVGSFWKFHLVVVKNNGKEMLVKKSVLHMQSCFFDSSPALPSPLSIIRFYILLNKL